LRKPVSELTDRELEDELQRRRRLRAFGQPSPPSDSLSNRAHQGLLTEDDRSWVAAASERVDLARHYAALELEPGASLAQVDSAYRKLVAKFHPDKHTADPEKHRAALKVVAELERSYQALSARLRR
jgi:DnaJ-domain-containing protein 1